MRRIWLATAACSVVALLNASSNVGSIRPPAGVAAIVNQSSESMYFGYVCGAVVVDPTTVVTAAHCVEGREPASLAVLVGVSSLCVSSQAERIPVSSVVVHPSYDSNTSEFDVAAIKLDETVRDVSLPIAAVEVGQNVRAFGWGIYPVGSSDACSLSTYDLTVIEPSECRVNSGTQRDLMVAADDRFCARPSNGSANTCIGDSGGPVFSIERGELFLVGVIAWGLGCGTKDPGAYTALASMSSWIDDHMDS